MSIASLGDLSEELFHQLCQRPLGQPQLVDLGQMATALQTTPEQVWKGLEFLDRCRYPADTVPPCGRHPRRAVEVLSCSLDYHPQGLRGRVDVCVPNFRQVLPHLPVDGWAALIAIEAHFGLFEQ